MVEGYEQGQDHEQSGQGQDGAVALGHLISDGLHQSRLAGYSDPHIGRKLGHLHLAGCLGIDLPKLGLGQSHRQINGEKGMLFVRHHGRYYRLTGGGRENPVHPLLLIRYQCHTAVFSLCFQNDIGNAGHSQHIRHLTHLLGKPVHGLQCLRFGDIIGFDDQCYGLGSELLHIEMIVKLVEERVLAHHALCGHSLHLYLLSVMKGGDGQKQRCGHDQEGIFCNPKAELLCLIHPHTTSCVLKLPNVRNMLKVIKSYGLNKQRCSKRRGRS